MHKLSEISEANDIGGKAFLINSYGLLL